MAKSVLIVEDEKNIAELLRLYLDKEGFQPVVAYDGGEGLRLFNEKEPDMVILDVMMPVMDGWTVLKEIRETSRVPIIMLTAKGETIDRVSGLEMGADDYIVKPFEMKRCWPGSGPCFDAPSRRRISPAAWNSTSWS
jgi:DNA-binding response OmpR family regulator